MDYETQKRIIEKTNRADEIAQALSRRHAELDGKLADLNARLRVLEEILQVELKARETMVVQGVSTEKKGFFGRVFGR